MFRLLKPESALFFVFKPDKILKQPQGNEKSKRNEEKQDLGCFEYFFFFKIGACGPNHIVVCQWRKVLRLIFI